MSSLHPWWALAHILLLVYWLGADLGVFYLSFYVRNRDIAAGTRAVLSRAMLALDLAPRVCLVLMLPTGLSLAADLGISQIRGVWLGVVWAVSLAWLAAVLIIYFMKDSRIERVLGRIDAWFRSGVCMVLVLAATVSLAVGYPFEAGWLAVKVALLGIIVALGLGIRIVLKPLGPALRHLLEKGSNSQSERSLSGALQRAYPMVLAIWASLIVAAYLGIAKP